MTTKKQADKCTTHHHACNCREYRYQQMESAIKVIHTWASVDGCLDAENVKELCWEALGKNEAD